MPKFLRRNGQSRRQGQCLRCVFERFIWILRNSTINVLCNAIDTNSYKSTGNFAHTLYLDNNVITTGEGAGITAYDGAIVVATSNTISGASAGFWIRYS